MGGISGLGNGSARRNYYIQGLGIGLDSFPSGEIEGESTARISSKISNKNDSRWHTDVKTPIDEDFNTELPMNRNRHDDSSTETILPLQGWEKGITKTVKVEFQRS
jgi:hypothetical protein